MIDEKSVDYIAFCLCWGLARYDANEVLQQTEGNNNGDSQDRHTDYRKG